MFIDFAGSDFNWPPTMKIGERRSIFDYIICPDWNPYGEELAINDIAYRRLLESNTLDASKGTHILLIHGKIVKYGNEISSEEHEEQQKEYPGCFYVPVVEKFVVIRK